MRRRITEPIYVSPDYDTARTRPIGISATPMIMLPMIVSTHVYAAWTDMDIYCICRTDETHAGPRIARWDAKLGFIAKN
jgi:hypothetical protein